MEMWALYSTRFANLDVLAEVFHASVILLVRWPLTPINRHFPRKVHAMQGHLREVFNLIDILLAYSLALFPVIEVPRSN